MHVLKANWAETSVTAATSHRTRPGGGIETGCEAVVAARSRPVEDDKGPIEREPSRRALELVGRVSTTERQRRARRGGVDLVPHAPS